MTNGRAPDDRFTPTGATATQRGTVAQHDGRRVTAQLSVGEDGQVLVSLGEQTYEVETLESLCRSARTLAGAAQRGEAMQSLADRVLAAKERLRHAGPRNVTAQEAVAILEGV